MVTLARTSSCDLPRVSHDDDDVLEKIRKRLRRILLGQSLVESLKYWGLWNSRRVCVKEAEMEG